MSRSGKGEGRTGASAGAKGSTEVFSMNLVEGWGAEK